MNREELTGRYYLLTETLLPQDASHGGWVMHEPLVLQRVILDYLFEEPWENQLDRGRVAIDQLDDDQLQEAVDMAEYLLAGGAERAGEMYHQSLVWRGKAAE